MKLFLANGFQNVSINEICRESQQHKQSVYNYFGDLDGYLHSVDPNTGQTNGIKRTGLENIKQIEISSNTLAVQDQAGKLKVYEIL